MSHDNNSKLAFWLGINLHAQQLVTTRCCGLDRDLRLCEARGKGARQANLRRHVHGACGNWALEAIPCDGTRAQWKVEGLCGADVPIEGFADDSGLHLNRKGSTGNLLVNIT